MIDGTIPTPIVDSRGRRTIVYRKPNSVSGRISNLFSKPAISASRGSIVAAVEEVLVQDPRTEHITSGGKDYYVTRALIGRDRHGNNLFVKVEWKKWSNLEDEPLNDDLELLDTYWAVSFDLYAQDRTGHGVGTFQSSKELLKHREFGTSTISGVVSVWDKYKHNSSRPGTEHQLEEFRRLYNADWSATPITEKHLRSIPDDRGVVFGTRIVKEVNRKDAEEILFAILLAASNSDLQD